MHGTFLIHIEPFNTHTYTSTVYIVALLLDLPLAVPLKNSSSTVIGSTSVPVTTPISRKVGKSSQHSLINRSANRKPTTSRQGERGGGEGGGTRKGEMGETCVYYISGFLSSSNKKICFYTSELIHSGILLIITLDISTIGRCVLNIEAIPSI